LFACASEAKGLLCWDEVPSTINQGRVADFFVPQLEGINNTSTCFEYIHHLPPAHFLIASQDTFKIQQYWQPDTITEHHFANSNDCYDAFREIFPEAVECRLHGVDKPAAMLTGGLDSSSIVALAQMSDRTNQISTFSGICAENADCNESWHINHMINETLVSPHFVSVDKLLPFIEKIESLFEHTDSIFDLVMLLPQLMYISAQQQGCVVLLDGLDGDYVTGQSTHYLSEVIRSGNIWEIARHCKAVSQFESSYNDHNRSSVNLFYRILRSMAVPEAVRKFRRYITRQKHTQQILENSLLSPECADRVNLKSRLDTHFQSSGLAESRTFREKNAQPIRSPYVSVALGRYDRVASAYSIEPRHPFF
jgi:asparagine synthase (glutamine-hydrolysing)